MTNDIFAQFRGQLGLPVAPIARIPLSSRQHALAMDLIIFLFTQPDS
jgi:hypothetical protein